MHFDWWTLLLQAVNVLILMWLLARFFYRPLLAIIEKRREMSDKLLADAKAAQAAADAQSAAVAATRVGFSAERDALLAEGRKQIVAEQERAHAAMAAETVKRQAEGEAAVARARKTMEEAIAGKAAGLAVEIARRLLASPHGEISERLSAQLRALPPHSRDLFAAAARGGTFTIVTAAPLDAAGQERCRVALSGALGVTVKPAFAADATLLAGFELRSDTLILKDNWRDDLGRILEDLKSDDGQEQLS